MSASGRRLVEQLRAQNLLCVTEQGATRHDVKIIGSVHSALHRRWTVVTAFLTRLPARKPPSSR